MKKTTFCIYSYRKTNTERFLQTEFLIFSFRLQIKSQNVLITNNLGVSPYFSQAKATQKNRETALSTIIFLMGWQAHKKG